MKGAESLGLLSNDLRCNICNRILRVDVLNVALCKCGSAAFWQSSLTLWERLMFWSGAWVRADLNHLKAITAPLGGEVNAHSKRMEELYVKET